MGLDDHVLGLMTCMLILLSIDLGGVRLPPLSSFLQGLIQNGDWKVPAISKHPHESAILLEDVTMVQVIFCTEQRWAFFDGYSIPLIQATS